MAENVLDLIYQGRFDEMKLDESFVENEYGKTILNLLRSKDDSLLLLSHVIQNPSYKSKTLG